MRTDQTWSPQQHQSSHLHPSTSASEATGAPAAPEGGVTRSSRGKESGIRSVGPSCASPLPCKRNPLTTSDFSHTGDGSASSLAKILPTTDFHAAKAQTFLPKESHTVFIPPAAPGAERCLPNPQIKGLSTPLSCSFWEAQITLTHTNKGVFQRRSPLLRSPPDPSTFPKAPSW